MKTSITPKTIIIFFLILFFSIPINYAYNPLPIKQKGYDVDVIIVRQSMDMDNILFGPGYAALQRYYKLNSVIFREPEVFALGTSRTMIIREEFFDNISFYNAAGGITTIHHFAPFVMRLPESYNPKIMIVGLDQYFFAPGWGRPDNIEQQFDLEGDFSSKINEKIKEVLLSRMDRWKYGTLPSVVRMQTWKIGKKGVPKDMGFRNDGSYYYGLDIKQGGVSSRKSEDFNFSHSKGEIKSGKGRFPRGTSLAENSLVSLEEYLDLCKERGIYVIGILPPYPHVVLEMMKSMDDRFSYIDMIMPTIEPMFEERGFEVHDFSDLADLGATDCEVIDGVHGSEKAFVRLFIEMSNHSEMVNSLVDREFLEEKLSESDNCFEVFE